MTCKPTTLEAHEALLGGPKRNTIHVSSIGLRNVLWVLLPFFSQWICDRLNRLGRYKRALQSVEKREMWSRWDDEPINRRAINDERMNQAKKRWRMVDGQWLIAWDAITLGREVSEIINQKGPRERDSISDYPVSSKVGSPSWQFNLGSLGTT